MASRSRNRSSFNTASRARVTLFWYDTIATVDSTMMSAVTTMSSISVNPAAAAVRARLT
jgi:hypothetical protein